LSTTSEYAAPLAQATGGKTFFGQPRGLATLFFTEMWERFSYYGMRALLILFMTDATRGGMAWGVEKSSAIYGLYTFGVYVLALPGGWIADRLIGKKHAVLAGGIVIALGHFVLAIPSESPYFLGLAFVAIGTGLLKPNVSAMVGDLYKNKGNRRDAGFSIFYMGINIGSFAATLLCGWLGETYGWKYGFGVAGIGMIIGLFTFTYGQRYLKGLAEPADPEKLQKKVFGPINTEWLIYLLSMPVLAVLWWLVQREHVVLLSQNILLIVSIVGLILYSMVYKKGESNNRLAFAIAGTAVVSGCYAVLVNLHFLPGSEALAENILYGSVALIIGFVVYGFKTHNSPEFGRTVVLMILILSTVVFWALFEQSAGSMTLYADRVLDREAFGTTFRASQFGSLNAGFIMLLAIPFAMLWTWLAKRDLEPNTPVKFGLGIMQAGLGFGVLVFGAQFPNEAGQVAMIWLILAYLLHTTGELCLSPVGLSAVTKLSIGNVVGVSMGTWFLATALSETLSTRIGRIAAIDTSEGAVADVASALATYTELYYMLMWIGIGTGIFMFLISPILKRWMHGIH